MTLRGIPELNRVSKADPYPIPRIEDIIDDIGQVSYITALDLIKGYWQVPVAKARVIGRCLWRKQGLLAGACGESKGYWQVPVAKVSQEKTAFVTPWGKYQFVTMPFGLVNTLSTFQRLIDQLLEGTQAFTADYLDDVIIHSRC